MLESPVNSKTPIRIISIIIIVVSVFASYFICNSDICFYRSNEAYRSNESVSLENGGIYQQPLMIDESVTNIKAVKLYFDVYKRINLSQMTVRMFSDDNLVNEWQFRTEEIGIDGSYTLKLNDAITVSPNVTYTIQYSQTYSGDNSVSLNRVDIKYPDSSPIHRIVLSIALLLTGLIIASCICFCSSEASLNSNKKYRMLLLLSVILMCVYSFVFEHWDGTVITGWGLELLDSTFAGDMRHYIHHIVASTDNIRYVPNYGVIANIITALSVLPLYVFQKISQIDFGTYYLQIYDCFRKLSLITSVLVTVRCIRKIVLSLSGNQALSKVAALFYCVSPVVLYGNLAMGQIDCIVVMFVALALYCIINEKYYKGLLILGLSVTIKTFPLFFFFVPFLCVYFGSKKHIHWLKAAACFLTPLVISKVLSTLVFIDYYKFQSAAERYWNHLGSLFAEKNAGNALFELTCILIFLIVAFYRNRVSESEQYKLFLVCCLSVVSSFLFFVVINPQWYIYPLLLLLVLLPYYNNPNEGLLFLPYILLECYCKQLHIG